jgi:putative ubiquitin-RnfH superfamily antitoxin RatB of RatAB toxin-antitoxin module
MAEPLGGTGGMCLAVVVAVAPGELRECSVHLPEGSTVTDALQACARAGLAVPANAMCGVWGSVVEPAQVLRSGDRVEVYRALTVDPKVARRQRFVRQGARTTGLFARQRPGGKAGY